MPIAAIMLAGALPVAAIYLLWSAWRAPVPDLAHTLTALRDNALPQGVSSAVFDPRTVTPVGLSLTDRIGLALMRRTPLRAGTELTGLLDLRGISPLRFYGQSVLCAAAYILFAVVLGLVPGLLGMFTLPVTVSLLGIIAAGVFGWFIPRIVIRSQAARTTENATEALLVYLDLVILERSADRSVQDALYAAAQASDAPLFTQVRVTLERSQLERESPWPGMHRLATKLNLPALADIADVARLQDEGSALTSAFRARSTELRNAYATRRQRDAEGVTQRMEITKTLPVLAVGALFLVPPLMKIAGT